MAGELILIADDEANIYELVKMYLQKDGFKVAIATNGLEALNQIKTVSPDLLILDVMMPEMDGWEVCRRVRADSSLPILMLTAKEDVIDKIIGLELGADDYLSKPFEPRELLARVKAILRRTTAVPNPAPPQIRRLGNVVIDPASRDVLVAEKKIELRTKEFDLLLTLADHVNKVLSRDQLLDLVWGYEFYGQTRTVDVHVAHLRDKLEGSNIAIDTVWGMGYKLVINN